MTGRKLIQNFRASRGLLFASPDFQAQTLERALARLGVALIAGEDADLGRLDEKHDILFVDGDLATPPPGLVAEEASVPAVPAIGIVGVEAPSRLRMLSEAGATAMLRKPIAASSVYSALFFGVNLHRQIRAMEARIAAGEKRRHERRYVVRATLALVRERGLSDDEAYAELRRESMRRRLTIEEFSRTVCEDEGAQSFNPGEEFADAPVADAGDNLDGALDGGSGGGRGPDQARRA